MAMMTEAIEFARRVLFGLVFLLAVVAQGASWEGKAIVVPVDDQILDNTRRVKELAGLVERADVEEAKVLVFSIKSSGRHTVAVFESILGSLPGAKTRTVASIDGVATGAGAVLALCCDEIYMGPQGVIGSAAPGRPGGDSEAAMEAALAEYRGTMSVLLAKEIIVILAKHCAPLFPYLLISL